MWLIGQGISEVKNSIGVLTIKNYLLSLKQSTNMPFIYIMQKKYISIQMQKLYFIVLKVNLIMLSHIDWQCN